MSRILSLIKTDLNTTFGLSALQYKIKNKRDRWQIIIFGVALISLIPSYLLIVSGLSNLYEAYSSIGQESMFLLNGFLYSQLIVFIFGILYVMSKYYFSNDLNVLVPLPLNPRDIIGSKFISLMVNEYLTSLPIILPFIIIYGTKGNEGILYWLYSLILILFVPIIPLALASIIVMLFMKYTNIKGRKDLLRIIGYFLLLIVLFTFQFKIQSITQNAMVEGEDFFLKMATDSNLLVRKLGLSFPPSMWGALSLSSYYSLIGLLNLILFVGVSIIVFLVMVYLSEKLFFDGLIGNLEVSISRGSSKVRASDYNKKAPAFLALGLKEIRLLIRTPVYLLNSIGGVVIVPIILVISTSMDGGQSLEGLNMLIKGNTHLISLVGVGIVTLLGIMNCVGCTTFSREGKNLWLQRTIPIKAKDQIFGRVLSSLLVQLIGVAAVLCTIAYLGYLTIEKVFWITILGVLGSIAMAELGMIIDIYRPLLDWDNPQKAMKQNLNVLIAMGIGAFYLLGVGFLVYKLLDKVDILLIYGIVGLVFIISAYGFYIILKKIIKRQFELLE
jgi:ABC-2 type transport system permease protein